MKKILLIISLFFFYGINGQTVKLIKTDIFTVKYSEIFQQPLELTYTIMCPYGDASRDGMDFYSVKGVLTSDNEDYKNNVWDKGHLAPAASFNCDKETLYKTFSYLNCALQHESLNRGPWRELEEFERDLAKVYDKVTVTIKVHFDDRRFLYTGAKIPSGFTKLIQYGDNKIECYFPNENVSGINWGKFIVE